MVALAASTSRRSRPQFLFDYASASTREWLALGISPRAHLRFAVWVCSVDLALAPIGLLAATSVGLGGFAFVATLPLIGLLELFARQRRLRIDHALELGQAYRGTAFLLGDMIEADDAYTGSHSQQVVELVLAVADGARRRRGHPARRGVRGPAPRRGEDPRPERDHQQARPTGRGRVGA